MAMTEDEQKAMFEKLKAGTLTPLAAGSVVLVTSIFLEFKEVFPDVGDIALSMLTHASVAAIVPDA